MKDNAWLCLAQCLPVICGHKCQLLLLHRPFTFPTGCLAFPVDLRFNSLAMLTPLFLCFHLNKYDSANVTRSNNPWRKTPSVSHLNTVYTDVTSFMERFDRKRSYSHVCVCVCVGSCQNTENQLPQMLLVSGRD